MSIVLRYFVMGGLARLVLRTVWAQMHVAHTEWLKITGRQRVGSLLTGMLHLAFGLPNVFVCGFGIWLISLDLRTFGSSIGFVVIDIIVLVMMVGAAQLAATQLATCFLDLVIAWRGAKPPTDLSAVIAASNWTEVR